jgi:hypothetical protein
LADLLIAGSPTLLFGLAMFRWTARNHLGPNLSWTRAASLMAAASAWCKSVFRWDSTNKGMR